MGKVCIVPTDQFWISAEFLYFTLDGKEERYVTEISYFKKSSWLRVGILSIPSAVSVVNLNALKY